MTGDIEPRVRAFLAAHGDPAATLTLLTPDASDRRYVRVSPGSGPSQVLAVHPGPIDFARMPFAHVHRLLSSMPVPVPRVLAHADALGIVALEDLGDVTLQAHLEATGRADLRARYETAIHHISTLQRRGAALASDDEVPFGLAFDVPKLRFELDFFAQHFLGGHRAVTLTPPAQDALEQEFAALAEELSAEPRVVCHRDYHSRNLMVRGDDLVLIDFQDARMGPDTYDLASLLRDAYVELDTASVDHLIETFLRLDRGPAGWRGDVAGYRERFDTMAVQRNLKALGTFGFQAAARGNPAYLRDVPRTLSYLRDTFARRPRFARLHDVLAAVLPELR